MMSGAFVTNQPKPSSQPFGTNTFRLSSAPGVFVHPGGTGVGGGGGGRDGGGGGGGEGGGGGGGVGGDGGGGGYAAHPLVHPGLL